MKYLLIAVLFLSISKVNAQSFFKPLSKPGHASGKFGLSAADSVMGSIRPVFVASASVSNGAQLSGGFGIGYQRNKWDQASDSWNTLYSISAVGFLGTDGTKMTGTGGIIIGVPGTNGVVGVGAGRDFTNNVWVFLTGVQIKFN